MPDYFLGRARGEVVVDYDDRGARDATQAMQRMDTQARRTAQGFDQSSRAATDHEQSIRRDTRAVEDNVVKSRRLIEAQENEAAASRERKNAHAELKEILKDETRTIDEQAEAQRRYNRAMGAHLQAAKEAKRVYREEVLGIQSVSKALKDLPGKKTIGIDVDNRRAMEKIADTQRELRALGQFAKVMAIGTAIGPAGGALGGLLGLAGGGAGGAGVFGLSGIIQSLGDMSGVIGLLPGVIGAAATAMGTFKLSTMRFGEAMKDLGTEDFVEAIKDLAPAAQNVALEINGLVDDFESFQRALEQAFFEPLSGIPTQLAATFRPILEGPLSQIANMFGQGGANLANWLMEANQQQEVQAFLANVVEAMNLLQPAVISVAEAFRDIMAVSGDFLPQLAQSITDMASEFASFIAQARESGELAGWIQTGIDAFKQFWQILKDFGAAFGTVMGIAEQYGGTMLDILQRWGEAFRGWTESAEGETSLHSFFSSLRTLMDAAQPVLFAFVNMISQGLMPILAQLGETTSGGWVAFFNLFSEGLETLTKAGPGQMSIMQQIGGTISQMLSSLGAGFSDFMTTFGPALPEIFNGLLQGFLAISQGMAGNGKEIGEILAQMANSFGLLMAHLGPQLPEILKAFGDAMGMVAVWLPVLAQDLAKVLPFLIRLFGIFMSFRALSLTVIIKAIDMFRFALVGLAEHVRWVGDQLGNFFNNFPQWAANVQKFIQDLWAWFDSLPERIGGALARVADAIGNWVSGLWQKGVDAGKALINGIRDGITAVMDMLPGPMRAVIEKLVEWLPGSPAKRGPLSGKGYTKERGKRMVEDFAAGIESAGGTAESAAAGTASSVSKAMSTDMRGLAGLSDQLKQFVGFGQNIFQVFSEIANLIFQGIEFATTDFKTGESTLAKKWERTVTDEDLAKQREDKAFQESLNAQDRETAPGATSTGYETAAPYGKATPEVKSAGTLGANPSKQEIANYIMNKALAEGYSREQANAFVVQAVGESNLDRKISGGVQGDDEVIGIFQEKTAFSGGLSREERMDAQKNIDAYFSQAAKAGGPAAFSASDPAEFLGRAVSGGGPWHPENQAKGHLTQAIAAAQPYIAGYSPPTQTPTGATPVTPENFKDKFFEAFGKDAPPVAQTPTDKVIARAPSGAELNVRREFAVEKGYEILRPAPGSGAPSSASPSGTPAAVTPDNFKDKFFEAFGKEDKRGVFRPEPYGLPGGTDTGGYGSSGAVFPAWVHDIEEAFGVKASTYEGHQEDAASGVTSGGLKVKPNPKGENRGIDWAAPMTPEGIAAMQKLADYLKANPQGLEQVIWRNPNTGATTEIGEGRVWPGLYGEGTLAGHENHVHTRQSMSFAPPGVKTGAPVTTPTTPTSDADAQRRADAEALLERSRGTPGEAGAQRALDDILAAEEKQVSAQDRLLDTSLAELGLSRDQLKQMEDPNFATDDQVASTLSSMDEGIKNLRLADTAESRAKADQLQSAQGGLASARGFGEGKNALTEASDLFGDVGSIAGAIFGVAQSTLDAIAAAQTISSDLVYGVKDTEGIMKMIDQFQVFIKLGADIAGAASTIIGAAGNIASIGGGMDMGASGAVKAAGQIFAMVQAGLEATNAMINLGQEAWRMAGKVLGPFLGYLTGGAGGALGGDVRFLFNRNEGELYAYSRDNPQDKRTHNVPSWMEGTYRGGPGQGMQNNQLNIYAGPGQSVRDTMNETMWLVRAGGTTGAAQPANF